MPTYTKNDVGKIFLWSALILAILGIILPAIVVESSENRTSFKLFDVVSDFGMAIYLVGVICLFKASLNASIGEKTRRFGICSGLLLLIPALSISSRADNINTEFAGLLRASVGVAYFVIFTSVGLTVMGSIFSNNATEDLDKYYIPQYEPGSDSSVFIGLNVENAENAMIDYCHECGSKNQSSANFCNECGYKL